MALPKYSGIGPYKQGVWIVVLPDGAAAIMDRALLPPPAKNTRYYWLGTTPDQASGRLPSAMAHLGLDVSTFPTADGIAPAFHGQRVGLSGDWNAPGAGGPKAGIHKPGKAPTVPGASYATGGGGGPLGFLANGISGVTDFLKFIAWLFHPLNLLRAVEFLTGIGTMFYGMHILVTGMQRNRSTHRTTLGSVFGWTPWGKELQFAKARRRGKRAGETQAERDVAYRGARQSRARQAGAGKRTTPGSGTGGTGQGSSALE